MKGKERDYKKELKLCGICMVLAIIISAVLIILGLATYNKSSKIKKNSISVTATCIEAGEVEVSEHNYSTRDSIGNRKTHYKIKVKQDVTLEYSVDGKDYKMIDKDSILYERTSSQSIKLNDENKKLYAERHGFKVGDHSQLYVMKNNPNKAYWKETIDNNSSKVLLDHRLFVGIGISVAMTIIVGISMIILGVMYLKQKK